MASEDQNLTIFAGRTVEIVVPVLDNFGNPFDLTGASATWGLARRATAPALLTKTSAAGQITFANVSGTWFATVAIVPADTAALNPASYYHELTVFDAPGDIANVTIGTLTLQASLNPP